MSYEWYQVGKMTSSFVLKRTPKWMMKWRWPAARLLQFVEIYHEDQPPTFQLNRGRGSQDLEFVCFNVFNFSPFDLVIVAYDIEILIDSATFIRDDKRCTSKNPIKAYSRGGFVFRHSLSDSQVASLKERPDHYVRLRLLGHVVMESAHGEIKKEFCRDVLALIDTGKVRANADSWVTSGLLPPLVLPVK
jgi:hypothetical protein